MKLTSKQKEHYKAQQDAFLSLADHARKIKTDTMEHFAQGYRGNIMFVPKTAKQYPLVKGQNIYVHGIADVFNEDMITVLVSPMKKDGKTLSSRTVAIPIELIEVQK